MDTEVNLVDSARLLFLQHVGLVLIVQEFDDGHPRISVIDIIAKARGINHGQTDCRQFISTNVEENIEYIKVVPLKNFSSSSALVISISTVLSTCFA